LVVDEVDELVEVGVFVAVDFVEHELVGDVLEGELDARDEEFDELGLGGVGLDLGVFGEKRALVG
jgi:hypothetical protein